MEANVFNIPSTDASVNAQGILASVQADTTDADIEDNEISAFDQGVLLFENPKSANLDRFSITGNDISDADTGILAVELAGDGDTFGDINGESATSDQETALENDNTFTGSVDTEANVQADT